MEKWTTNDEIAFIATLSPRALRQYEKAALRRREWCNIDKKQILRYAERRLKEYDRKTRKVADVSTQQEKPKQA